MRTIATALALSVLVAALAGGSSTVAAPVGRTPAAPAAGRPIECGPVLGTVGDDGHYRSIHVGENTAIPPEVHDFGPIPGLTSIRSLATGTFDADTMVPDQAFQQTQHLGTGDNVLLQVTAWWDKDGPRAAAQNLESRWSGLRRTVFASSMLPDSYLYGLHDNGSLYRFLVTSSDGQPQVTAAGQVTGFGAVRSMALIGRTPEYDALIVNTTTGRLDLVKIPTTAEMTVDVTTIRDSGWADYDHVLAGNCDLPYTGRNATALVGVNSSAGVADAYQVGFLRDASAPIESLGRLAGDWHYRILAGAEMGGAHPRGA